MRPHLKRVIRSRNFQLVRYKNLRYPFFLNAIIIKCCTHFPGNKTTLSEIPKEKGISVLDAALEFRSNYYVSNIMTLVVYAKDSLKKLEEVCVQLFSKIKDNKDITLPHWDDWPYGQDELRKKIDIVSISDIRDFFLVFPMANMRPFYKTFVSFLE